MPLGYGLGAFFLLVSAFDIYRHSMLKRSRIRGLKLGTVTLLGEEIDLNELASRVTALATNEKPKNEAAVALGRLGGKKGGPARAKALSKKRRSEIARGAAKARWKKRKAQSSESPV